MFGALSIEERLLRRATVQVRPLALRLRVEAGGYTRNLSRALVDFGAEESFAHAAERLALHHGVNLCASTIRKLTYRHAQAIQNRHEAQRVSGALPGRGAGTIVAEIDGTMLPTIIFGEGPDKRCTRQSQWREYRLCAAREQGSSTAFYGVSQGSVEQAGESWVKTIRLANWGVQSYVHAVCDGAEWIREQCRQRLGQNARLLIDFYHVSEYIAAAATAFPDVPNWLENQQLYLKDNQAKRVIETLFSRLEPDNTPDELAPVRMAWRYLNNRAEHLDYRGAIARDLPIGSGLIEGGNRHVLQKRLKISGAWWRSENALAMAHLRVERANQHEKHYWEQTPKAA